MKKSRGRRTAHTTITNVVILTTALRHAVCGSKCTFLICLLFRHALKNTTNSHHTLDEPKQNVEITFVK
jgi:hypothetical protein